MEPPAARHDPVPLELRRGGLPLAGERAGAGPPVLLLHGLTATRRYVLHGSRALERAGLATIAYDARGHGESGAAPGPAAYAYPELVADALAVLDACGVERAALVGHSMGSATAVSLALNHPERASALVVVCPAHRGVPSPDLARWDALADALERGGADGFLAALEPLEVQEVEKKWRETIRTVVRQRLRRHRHPEAVADALRGVPRSTAFAGIEALAGLRLPTLVVGSRDALDAGHPLEVAERYARTIPGAELVVEAEGESPLAWRGGRLSAAILAFLARAGVAPAQPSGRASLR